MKELIHRRRKIEESLPKELEGIVLKQRENLRKRLKDGGRRRVQQLIYGRTLIIIVLLLVQIYLLLSMIFWLQEYSMAIYGALELVALITVVVIMNRRENPCFKMSWLVLIIIFPIVGAALYVYVQNQIGSKVAAWRLKQFKQECEPMLKQRDYVLEGLRQNDLHLSGLANYIHSSCGHPVYQHTKAEYFPIGEEKFRRLLLELNHAENFIFLEYFIIREGIMWDSVLEILKQKVKEGVEVRVMYDGLCTFTNVPAGYYKELRKMGIHCKVFGSIKPLLSTVQNNRDHRKIAVIDGKVAFTGGINLADEYINEYNRFGHWKDTAIMLTGEVVQSFTIMFLNTWNIDSIKQENYEPYLLPSRACQHIQSDGFLIPYADNPFDEFYVGKHIYLDIIASANCYVHIMTPYLILDNETIEALCYAAARGVDVKIILPHVPDKKYAFWLAKSYYQELLIGGVRIFEYIPGFVHAKGIVSDDSIAVCGSSNLDFRSFYLHYECGVVLYQNSEIASMEEDMNRTFARCKEILLEDCKKEKWYVQLIGPLLRLVAPLM